MKLTVQLKLQPTPIQASSLKRTLETANAACDYISQVAFSTQTFRQFPIHRLTYQAARETFRLATQLTVRCIAKVADAYKLDRKVQRTFQPHGAIAYDERILSFALPDSLVSIWTLDGRQAIPFVCGERGANCSNTSAVKPIWYSLAEAGTCSRRAKSRRQT